MSSQYFWLGLPAVRASCFAGSYPADVTPLILNSPARRPPWRWGALRAGVVGCHQPLALRPARLAGRLQISSSAAFQAFERAFRDTR